MPRPEKVQAVEKIREQLDEARATFVTEYRGLTVTEQQQLRRSVQQARGEYRVLKMSLARLAVEDMALEGFPELLAGPTALAFAIEDPVPVAKVLRDFASDHDKLIIKGGILGGALLLPEQISRLAEIESREVLLSKIAGGFKAPMSKLAGLLGAKMRDAASVFSQLLEKKEEEQGPAEVETPVAETESVTEEATAAEPVVEDEAPAEAAEVVVEEVPEAVAEEVAEAVADEAEEVPDEEPADVVVEEVPEAVAEEVAEAVADEAEEVPDEEPADVVVEEVPEAVAEEVAEAEADEAPGDAAEAAAQAEAKVEKAAPKKKAAPKAKATPKAKTTKSSAKADASAPAEPDETTADESDETAEEE